VPSAPPDTVALRRQYRQNILAARRWRGVGRGSSTASQTLPLPPQSTAGSSSSSSTSPLSMSLDNSFPYELPMDWRPSQSFEYQPYPSPYPSPAPSYVTRPSHTTANHSSVSSNGPPTASPTLSSTSSPHHAPAHAHSHSHSSHNGPIDPSLQEPYAHSWSHPPQHQSTQSPVTNHSQILNPANSYATPPPSAKPASAMSRQELEQELARLKTRVNELEVVHHWFELKGMRGDQDVQHHHPRLSQPLSAQHHGHQHNHVSSVPSMPSALHTPPGSTNSPPSDTQPQIVMGGVAPTEEFAASWRARTDARIKRFCALNRAGNALCAWHDSRRERRAYPPRQAPPGYLNCGCTEEEGKDRLSFPCPESNLTKLVSLFFLDSVAFSFPSFPFLSFFLFFSRVSCLSHFGRDATPSALFEESLARHGVGSYHPGEMVRMDPALRNPLLKLLERRFGYVDGDFERDPTTGHWVDGEGAEFWETILPSGKPPVSGGRKRGETK